MASPLLSQRGRFAPASPIRRLTPFADEARLRGVHVHHLNIGQPDIPTVETMRKAYQEFAEPVVAYSPSQGFLSVRQAWANYYNTCGLQLSKAIDTNEVLITVGGSEALLFAMATACDVGEQILVVEPYYTNYYGIAHLLGVEVGSVSSYAHENFVIKTERVAQAITPKTRALIVPSPGNPTGMVVSRQGLHELADLCRQHGLFFIVDEVYREFVYDDELVGFAPSVLEINDFDEYGVMIDSVSKRYSACGARIGCLVTRNRLFYESCLRFAQARLSPPTVDQFAAIAALATPKAEIQAMIHLYKQRRDVLVAGLQSIPGVSCSCPQGAFYLIAELPVENAERFCIFMLREFSWQGETVMLAPAEGFYASKGLGRNQVRIAYVLEQHKLVQCVEVLRAGLAAYSGHG